MLFSLLDHRLWIAVALATAVAGAGGYFKGRSDGHALGAAEIQKRWDAHEAERTRVARKAEDESRARERAMQEKANVAIAQSAQRAARAAADARAARSELDGLRDVLAKAPRPSDGGGTTDTCRAADDRARAVGGLLAECAAAYQDVARAADGHLRDAMSAREAWPTTEAK